MNYVNVAIAVIHRSGHVLITQRRKDDSFADLWEFPGGKVEPDESAEQCLTREIQEELGVEIEIGEQLSVIEHVYPHTAVRLMPFLCELPSGTPRALAAQSLKWVSTSNLREHPFPAANAGLIEEIIERLASSASQ